MTTRVASALPSVLIGALVLPLALSIHTSTLPKTSLRKNTARRGVEGWSSFPSSGELRANHLVEDDGSTEPAVGKPLEDLARSVDGAPRAEDLGARKRTKRQNQVVLPTPSNLKVTSAAHHSINLQWQYERGDVEFVVNVYYSDGSFAKDQVVRGTSATVVGLAPSTTYQFSVKAAKALPHGQRANSADSERVTARTQGTPPVQPPRPPTTTTTTPAPQPPTSAPPPPPQPAPPQTSPPPAAPTVGDRCRSEGLCVCPTPHQHVCAPCDMINTCSKIAEDAVCSTEPAAGSAGMTVSVLSCGSKQHAVNVEGILRANGGVKCDSGGKVPAHTVALVECWGSITVLVECQTDGTWRPYGNHQSHAPSHSHLCQFENVNSPLCGHRPLFQDVGGVAAFPRPLPHWPWLAGLFLLKSYICTATIISRQFLLTAAHCVTRTQETSKETVDVRNLRVQHLDSKGLVIKRFAKSIHVSPEFRAGIRPSHDVALVRLEEPITYSYHVYPACLNIEGFPRHTKAATFNRTSLRYSWDLLPQGPDSRCHAPHDNCAASIDLDEDQFCATDIESGQFLAEGSSGGPYLVNVGNDAVEQWVVAGLISSSYSLTSCARPVTICTSLAEFWPWISRCVQQEGGGGNCS